jgi:hypothetical protein
MAARLMINEVSKLKPGTKAFKTICTITKAEGGSVDDCVSRVAKEPNKFAEKFKNLTAESGPLAKVKQRSYRSSTIKASKSRALGIERKPKGFVKTGLRVLGRGLGVAASPALLAPFAVGDIASQVAEGDTPEDIATNPFNYLYPAFADQTDKLTRGLSPTIRKVAKLGLPKIALRGLSRAGIGGFAASSVIQGLGLLDD